ncbi:MAG TPA: GNAT family N-acetyltransferase [Flavobacteriaceae bacterium]|nr:GNAT family N-acetyltransferase [Flavobacteriaceae bacterium]
MDFLIRKATVQDMPEVLELIKELAVFEKEPDAVQITTETLKEEGFGKTPMFTCFVAESHATLVGMALVYPRFSTWKGKALHLEDLIVSQPYRGKGVGLALYKEVMRYAKQNQMNRVQWEVLNWNTPAIDFYENTGAKVLKDWHVVHIHSDEISKLATG